MVEPGRQLGQVGLQRGRVHGHEHVGGVARRDDVVVGDVHLERRDAGDGAGRGTDLGRVVRHRRQVVAEHGADVGEAVAGELHAVAGVAGEPDDDLVEDGRARAAGSRVSRSRVPHLVVWAHAGIGFEFECGFDCTEGAPTPLDGGGRVRTNGTEIVAEVIRAPRGLGRPCAAPRRSGVGRGPGRRARPRRRPVTPRRPGIAGGDPCACAP